MKVFSPKSSIFVQTFSDEKIFDNFSTVKNLGFAPASPHHHHCSLATAPQPVNRIESDLLSAESPTSIVYIRGPHFTQTLSHIPYLLFCYSSSYPR